MRGIMRNVSFRRELLAYALLGAVFTVAGFIVSPGAGAVAAGLSLAAAILTCFLSRRRYRRMGELAEELDRILHGGERYDLDQFSEGELSILCSQLSKLLITLRSQAEELKRDKAYLADSLADISHQLKTPLTSVNLALSMLSEPALSDERRLELTRDISGQLTRLEWLVSALLKLSRLDAGTVKLSPRRISLSALVEAAASPLLIAMELRGVELVRKIDPEAYAIADPAWSAEAIGNILKNCVEHTPAGGRVTVEGRGNAIFGELVISDTGPGIHRDDLPHIFERFYRGKNADPQSVGIGLALARQVIQSSGGTVKAENGPQGGAKFTVRFFKSTV